MMLMSEIKRILSHGVPRRARILMRLSILALLWSVLLGVTSGQSSLARVPEAAFVSPQRYTNAFFGFYLPLPEEQGFHTARVKASSVGEHYLFALGREQANTTLVISAQQMKSEDAAQLMRAAPLISLHGIEFGKGVSDKKTREGGRIWKAVYLTVIGNYLVEFNIQSLDSGMAKKLENCVEEIRFFEPSKAGAVAGVNSVPYNPSLSDAAQSR
jgi:hypothetical protein